MKVTLSIPKLNTGKIILDDFDIFDRLRDHFSIETKNFQYIKRCRQKQIRVSPSKEYIRKSVIKMNGEFELGLFYSIIKWLKSECYTQTVNYEFDENIKKYIQKDNFSLDSDVFVNENGDKPRDYQIESMKIALNHKNGLYILGTGAGKTLCTSLLCHNILKNNLSQKILIICPFPDLANQTADEISKNLKDYNYSISKWFGKNKFSFDSQIIVAGSDIIRSQFSDYKNELKSINCVIVDEVHQLKNNNKISEIIKQLPAIYRYGFTGTLPDSDLDKWSVEGKIGPVRYNLSSYQLRENKFLTPVEVIGYVTNLKDIPKTVIMEDGTERPFTYMDEIDWLASNEELNNIIKKVSINLNNNSLILVNRLSHAENILSLLKSEDISKKVLLIQGDVPIDERTDIKKIMEESNDVILIAQVQTFSTGINVKNIHNIIFPGVIGKSSVRIIQSIGRGLRLNKNKTKLRVFDIVANSKYAYKHWEIRQKIYQSENIPVKKFSLK